MDQKTVSAGSTPASSKMPWLVFMIGSVALALGALFVWTNAPKAVAEVGDVVVYKVATCGCCEDWVTHLRDSGLEVSVVNVDSTQPIRMQAGVPAALGSCHTAVVGDYWIEGHVPADLVRQLLTERPENILGIAVPGMPIGSPGMEGPNPETYDVLAYDTDGRTFVYATRQGQAAAEDE